MTPGIQPSNVKIMLRKKLAIRPVMSTASGGKTTQKKYRSAFITNFSSSASSCALDVGRWALGVGRWAFSYYFRGLRSAARNLRSPDSTADHGKGDANAIQNLRFVLQYQSPCICRS